MEINNYTEELIPIYPFGIVHTKIPEIASESLFEDSLVSGTLDIPKQSPVDFEKIAEDMEDWKKAMRRRYQTESVVVYDPKKCFSIIPSVLVEPPTEEEKEVLKSI